jgi:ribosomal protein S6
VSLIIVFCRKMFALHGGAYSCLIRGTSLLAAFVAEQKGKIWRVNDWGLRRLAYKIKKNDRANYVLMNIEMKAAAINELNTMIEKDERVIRHMCISQKEAHTEDTVPPPNYYCDSADGTEAQEEDDFDDDEEEEDEDDEEEEDEPSSSQENRGWDQAVQGQESSVAL